MYDNIWLHLIWHAICHGSWHLALFKMMCQLKLLFKYLICIVTSWHVSQHISGGLYNNIGSEMCYDPCHQILTSIDFCHIHIGHRFGLTGSALDHGTLPPEFESRRGHIWRVFHLLLRFITYHVHKSGRKTSLVNHHIHIQTTLDDVKYVCYINEKQL